MTSRCAAPSWDESSFEDSDASFYSLESEDELSDSGLSEDPRIGKNRECDDDDDVVVGARRYRDDSGGGGMPMVTTGLNKLQLSSPVAPLLESAGAQQQNAGPRTRCEEQHKQHVLRELYHHSHNDDEKQRIVNEFEICLQRLADLHQSSGSQVSRSTTSGGGTSSSAAEGTPVTGSTVGRSEEGDQAAARRSGDDEGFMGRGRQRTQDDGRCVKATASTCTTPASNSIHGEEQTARPLEFARDTSVEGDDEPLLQIELVRSNVYGSTSSDSTASSSATCSTHESWRTKNLPSSSSSSSSSPDDRFGGSRGALGSAGGSRGSANSNQDYYYGSHGEGEDGRGGRNGTDGERATARSTAGGEGQTEGETQRRLSSVVVLVNGVDSGVSRVNRQGGEASEPTGTGGGKGGSQEDSGNDGDSEGGRNGDGPGGSSGMTSTAVTRTGRTNARRAAEERHHLDYPVGRSNGYRLIDGRRRLLGYDLRRGEKSVAAAAAAAARGGGVDEGERVAAEGEPRVPGKVEGPAKPMGTAKAMTQLRRENARTVKFTVGSERRGVDVPRPQGVYRYSGDNWQRASQQCRDVTLRFVMNFAPINCRGVRRLPDSQIKSFMKQLFAGLKVCEASHVIHGKIVPENLIVRELVPDQRQGTGLSPPSSAVRRPVLSLADFGCAMVLPNDELSMRIAEPFGSSKTTPVYHPPESRCYPHVASHATDVWSAGVILAEMIFSNHLIARLRMRNGGAITDWKAVNESFEGGRVNACELDFLAKCLEVDPKQRLTIDGALCHEWLG